MTISNDPVVIVSAARTPMGGFQGDFKGLTAPQLGAAAIRAAVERAGVADNGVEEVLFGCVLSAGLGQAPARQAWKGGPTRRICLTGRAAATAWAMAGCWITCSSTAWKTPTTVAA